MPDYAELSRLREAAAAAELAFEATLEPAGYIDCWHFYKADDDALWPNVERLPGHETVVAAHDAWMTKLHDYHLARDGERGVLGSRGL